MVTVVAIAVVVVLVEVLDVALVEDTFVSFLVMLERRACVVVVAALLEVVRFHPNIVVDTFMLALPPDMFNARVLAMSFSEAVLRVVDVVRVAFARPHEFHLSVVVLRFEALLVSFSAQEPVVDFLVPVARRPVVVEVAEALVRLAPNTVVLQTEVVVQVAEAFVPAVVEKAAVAFACPTNLRADGEEHFGSLPQNRPVRRHSKTSGAPM